MTYKHKDSSMCLQQLINLIASTACVEWIAQLHSSGLHVLCMLKHQMPFISIIMRESHALDFASFFFVYCGQLGGLIGSGDVVYKMVRPHLFSNYADLPLVITKF